MARWGYAGVSADMDTLADRGLSSAAAPASSAAYRFDFHNITSWSAPPEAKKLPSCENRAQFTGPEWPCRENSRRPSRRSQIFRDVSFDEESK